MAFVMPAVAAVAAAPGELCGVAAAPGELCACSLDAACSKPSALRAAAGQPHSRPLLQIAPMMEVTYKDFRQFMRLLTRETQLWTEMWVDNTLLHAERVDGFLDHGPNEHPIVCQLGGSSPASLAAAAHIVAAWGYDEVNLNCGCPSDRVAGKGEFGASLMRKPELVRDCCREISEAVRLPVTVKCRLGVDDDDSPEFTARFVRTVAEAGVRHFIIHARKCILKGLTPDQNRKIPPLMYDRVHRLCREFPQLHFTLNGGITSLEEVRELLDGAPPNLVGAMVGRAALNNPSMLGDADRYIYGCAGNPPSAESRYTVLNAYAEYLDQEYPPGCPARSAGSGPAAGALKPILGTFHGLPGNKIMRQGISRLCLDKAARAEGPGGIIRQILSLLEADPLAAKHLHEPLRLSCPYWTSASKGNSASSGACIQSSHGNDPAAGSAAQGAHSTNGTSVLSQRRQAQQWFGFISLNLLRRLWRRSLATALLIAFFSAAVRPARSVFGSLSSMRMKSATGR